MKYIVFGAGDTGRLAIDVFGRDNIVFFIDNSVEKQGHVFEGYQVYSLSQVMDKVKQLQIIIAVTPRYESEIIRQLEAEGISDYIIANRFIYEMRKKRMLERKNCIDCYKRAVSWIHSHSIDNKGITVTSSEHVIYPEVTGYYIPTLLRWGYRELALSYAKGLIEIQRDDGAWNGPNENIPYVFDTGQILKGLLAISPFLPESVEAAKRGADWILSRINEEGRLVTPNSDEWGEDESVCSDLIHIYCLSPLVELSGIIGDDRYRKAADRVLDYYLKNHYDRIVNFRHLSHFHAYLMEALLDMGREDIAQEAMHNMERHQRENGAIPAYNNCNWVCSTGLFQLALVWFRLGNVERGNKAFAYALNLQNDSGGWFGSYLSEESADETNTYFPLSEISWANKYFLDALYYKNKAEFDEFAPQFLDSITDDDGRYEVIRKMVCKLVDNDYAAMVADIGCGKGRYIKKLREEFGTLRYVCVDISEKVMSFCDDMPDMRMGTLTNIPLKDNEADLTYTCEALEHAVDIETAICEMARVTRHGGRIVVIDKNKEQLGRFELSEWEQWFNIDELKAIMEQYCTGVTVQDDIPYEGHDGDGLFCAWIGIIR